MINIPKFSIITINYNNAIGLKKTMDSVLAQDSGNFEYLVIDGGSTDDSLNIIKTNEEQLAYWCSEKDEGIYHAMNKGMKQAKGDFLIFMNSGDSFFSKDTLNKLFENIRKTKADIYFTPVNFVGSNNNVLNIRTYPEKLSLSFFFKTSLCHQGTIISKEVFSNLGLYDQKYHLVADWKLLLDSYLKGYTFKYIDLVSCNFDNNGVSHNKENNQKQRLQVIREHYPLMETDWNDIHQLASYQKSRPHQWIEKLRKWLK